MDKIIQAAALLPLELRALCENYASVPVEEIRLRIGKKPTVLLNGYEKPLREKAVSEKELEYVVERACGASLHAHMHEIRRGYINSNGLRIGFCGCAVYKDGQVSSFKNFSSLSVRIPSQFRGELSQVMDKLKSSGYTSTLLISPPGGGKTTLLRELIRLISEGGKRLAVVDERNELAAFDGDKAYFDLGAHTDVMVGVEKSEGAMMLLRGMTPEIIAIDEISRREDLATVFEIAGCGVAIFATAHGRSLEELRQRELYRSMLQENIFKNLICISTHNSTRKYEYMRIAH